jgi:hypothetical protein
MAPFYGITWTYIDSFSVKLRVYPYAVFETPFRIEGTWRNGGLPNPPRSTTACGVRHPERNPGVPR